MGQVFSTEEELSQAMETIGSLLYDVMLEGGAVPELSVVHPLLLTNHKEGSESRDRLQEPLQQLHSNIGNRAPAYLKDLIGRLSTFSEDPRLAGLVGMLVTMVMDMIYTSRKQPSSAGGKSAGSSSCQRMVELQEVMEEYLKRFRINLSDKSKLIQDLVRLEAQLSLSLTQLKTCLLGGDCDSRSVRHWASAAAFHSQMLVHLAALEGKQESPAAKAALQQYREDLMQIIPAYRRYKTSTVCVTKCRGGFPASRDPPGELPEDGSMTGITVTDRETGKSVTISSSALEELTGKLVAGLASSTSPTVSSSAVHPDLITSDQYAEAYLHRLFSANGPVAELENYFIKAGDTNRNPPRSALGSREETSLRDGAERGGGEKRVDGGGGGGGGEAAEGCQSGGDSLKLSIVETQPLDSLSH